MSNGNVIRMPTQQGNWMWDGSQWTCGPCDSVPPFPFCPPPGFPPAGCPPWFSGANSPPWYPGANAGVSFGQNPPTNPVRGHYWWDGTGLAIFDGAVWANVVNARIVPPGQTIGSVATGGQGSGGAIISTTPPASPVAGQMWWNSSIFQVFDGTVWKVVGPSVGSVVSTTAPPSPMAGMEWWNGTILQLWDGTKWNAIGPSSSVMGSQTQHTFAMPMATSLTVGTSTWTPVPFNSTPTIDTQNAYTSSNFRLTPKVAGSYILIARGFGSTSGQGIAIAKNDGGVFSGAQTDNVIGVISNSTGGGWMYITGVTMFNGTTDFVRVFGFSSTGTWLHTGASDAFGAWLLP